MRRISRRWGLVSIGVLMLFGCRAAITPDSQLTTDRSLAKLLDPTRPTAVLFYSPASCLSCATALPEWQAIGRSQTVKVVILLDREPTDEEWKILRIARVKVDGVYHRPWYQRSPPVPQELLFQAGRQVAAWDGSASPGPSRALMLAAATVRATVDSTFAPYIPEVPAIAP